MLPVQSNAMMEGQAECIARKNSGVYLEIRGGGGGGGWGGEEEEEESVQEQAISSCVQLTLQ